MSSLRRVAGINQGDPTKPRLFETLYAPPPWTLDALCAQVDPEAFYPSRGGDAGGSVRQAKKVCGNCPVAAECLAYALAHNERYGIWGGLSDRERRKLRRGAA